MRRSPAILVAILCALCLHARGQTYIYLIVEHDWEIHYGTNRVGLMQYTMLGPQRSPTHTYTEIRIGPRSFRVPCNVWVVAGVMIFGAACLGWLAYYGIGVLYKPAEKPPPPDPSPPP